MTTFGLVVPWRPRGYRGDRRLLRQTLESIAPQLSPGDTLILSAQVRAIPSPPFELPEAVHLVLDPEPPARWNIARARNRGLVEALRLSGGLDYLWPVDADLTLPPGALARAREVVSEHPGSAWAPIVRDAVRDAGPEPARTRIGSGVAFLPVSLLVEANGWAEAFEGYGSEDIDLFYRLDALHPGYRVEPWRDGPVLEHTPHPPQSDKVLCGRANMERLCARRAKGGA